MPKSKNIWDLEDHIYGTIYGNCIGDAIGLLTEFMDKEQAKTNYDKKKNLEYDMKVPDMHRMRWAVGDWTDDSDQMILIIQSLLDNKGKVVTSDYAAKLKMWSSKGFPELGDFAGMGIGATTHCVLNQKDYLQDPHKAAQDVWERSGRDVAPNGGVMRTSFLGVHQYQSLDDVTQNTLDICKTSHADPRCQASCVAVTTAVALMLQRPAKLVNKDGTYKVGEIITQCYEAAKKVLPPKQHKELHDHMFASSLKNLKLAEDKKIGYTLKCLGAGFWAIRQKDFRKALQELVMEGGDADTNGAVAGALLGCKLGASQLPQSWLTGLKNKAWLDEIVHRYFVMMNIGKGSLQTEGATVSATDGSGEGAQAGATASVSTGTEAECADTPAEESEATARCTTGDIASTPE